MKQNGYVTISIMVICPLARNFVGFFCRNPFSFPLEGEGWLTKFRARGIHSLMLILTRLRPFWHPGNRKRPALFLK